MMRLTTILIVAGSLAATASWAQAPAAPAASYRASADVQLLLTFQGIAEGGISRGLRLFGATGRCQAWYRITEVIAAPASLPIRDDHRLKLEYACGEDRAYVAEPQTSPLNWAEAGGGNVNAWLRSSDISPDREQTWIVRNPENRLAPAAVQHQE